MPKVIVCDYEIGLVNALKHSFPDTHIQGCNFHLAQCVWRGIQSAGLQTDYSEDEEMALNLRMLSALSYVPIKKVKRAYDSLIKSQYYVENKATLEPVVQYFGFTWMEKQNREGQRGNRRGVTFPIDLWNVQKAVTNHWPRTNNAAEGWHNRFSSRLRERHPSLWKLIQFMKSEQSVTETKMTQLCAGQEEIVSQQQSRKDARIEAIVSDYKNRDILEYLRGLAFNIKF